MIDIHEVLPQYCPECGSGVEKLPNGYLLCRMGNKQKPWEELKDCAECKRRSTVRWAKIAYEREKKIIEAILR